MMCKSLPQIEVSGNGIPEWGRCVYRAALHAVVLEAVVGGQSCIRCFAVHMRSANVVQVRAEMS